MNHQQTEKLQRPFILPAFAKNSPARRYLSKYLYTHARKVTNVNIIESHLSPKRRPGRKTRANRSPRRRVARPSVCRAARPSRETQRAGGRRRGDAEMKVCAAPSFRLVSHCDSKAPRVKSLHRH